MFDDEKMSIKDYIVFGIFIIFLVGCISAAVYGNVKWDKDKRNYSESLLVDASYSNVTEHLVAPYHGGEIYTRYTYYKDYTWTVNDKEYKVTISVDSRDKVNPLPQFINIYYNPNEPSKFYIDKNEDDNSKWYFYHFTFYEDGGFINPKLVEVCN